MTPDEMRQRARRCTCEMDDWDIENSQLWLALADLAERLNKVEECFDGGEIQSLAKQYRQLADLAEQQLDDTNTINNLCEENTKLWERVEALEKESRRTATIIGGLTMGDPVDE